MSKESFIGGDYIETTGGSAKKYGAQIELSGSQVILNGEINGVSLGINQEPPIVSIETDFYVDVFRDRSQIEDNFGKKDVEYKGNFGFDRYNETTSGKGKQSTNRFELIYLNGYTYHVPWLSLWPPKRSLQNIVEIDSNYNPVTSAKLTLKIYPGKTKNGDAKFSIISNHSNIKVDEKDMIEKKGSINNTVEVTISCVGVLENDTNVEIKNDLGLVVGKLKIVKNNVVYIANAKFITVMEEEKETKSENKKAKREAEKTSFQNLIKSVILYLNENSLNQALVYVKGSVEDVFVIDKGEINRNGSVGDYSNSITVPYFEGKNNNKNIDDSKETKEEKELDKSIKKLYYSLEKNYKKNRKNVYFCDDTIKQTPTELFLQYEDKYQIYLNSLAGDKKIGGHIRDNKTVYIFVDKNQETLDIGSFSYYGYTLGKENCAFVFNKHVKDRKFGTFAHELAHSLGLEHTFELNENNYQPNKTINKNIEQKEDILKEKKQNNQPQNTSIAISRIQKGFTNIMEKNLHFPVVQKPEQISANFDGNDELYYSHINSMFINLKSLAISENEAKISDSSASMQNMVNPIVSLQNEIRELNAKKVGNKNKYIDVNISETQENFMDYDYDSSGAPNSNFEPKSFWNWQWKELSNSEYITSIFLK